MSLIAIAIGISSCRPDDSPSTSGNLLRKWYYKEYKISGFTVPYDDHEDCGKDYIEFLTATTGKEVDVFDCTEDEYPFTYTRNGNSVTITESGETYTAQILELTSSKLRVKVQFDFDDDGIDDDVTIVFTSN